MNFAKQRIEFIDLAKGVCILLVVMEHVGLSASLPGLRLLRVPLYFILSGLFFKDYGSYKTHTLMKTNRILIPFAFFYLTGYLLFYILEWFAPTLLQTDAKGILDVFTQRQYFNGPIWFLLCLFWCNLMFCAITLLVKSEIWRVAIVLVCGAIGYTLGEKQIFVPLVADISLTALPFFYLGYWLKKTPILYPNNYDKWNWAFTLLLYGICILLYLAFDPRFHFHYNKPDNDSLGGAIATYIMGACSVIFILLICKMIKKLPVISYFGRYSIIILCTHHLVYRPIKIVVSKFAEPEYSSWIVLVLTMSASLFIIPLCIKYIPYFTAQKDLIKTSKNGK